MVEASFTRFVMAVERVEHLLRKTTGALNAAGIGYAIIGGNAVAAWVAQVDEAAARTTKDVNILIRRSDVTHVSEALRPIDLTPIEVLGVYMYVDRHRPNPWTGVHVVFAGARVRPDYTHPAPDPCDSVETNGFHLIELRRLVEMKLQAYGFIDRAHLQDMLNVGLIDDAIRDALPPDLREHPIALEESPDSNGSK